MATGGAYLRSVLGGSEQFYDFSCTPCADEGRDVEAANRCVDCGQNFCAKCLKYHNKFEGLKAHRVLDKTGMKAGARQAPVFVSPESCTVHPGKPVEMFCGEHDVVCCGICINIDHRLCQGVNYIPIVAKGFKSSSELRDAKESMRQFRKDLERSETIRNIYLKAIQKDKETCLADIDSFRDNIVQYLDRIVKKAKEVVCEKTTTLKSGINTSIQKLHDMISQLNVSIRNLETCKQDNEPQLFFCVKQWKGEESQGRQLLQEVGIATGREALNFDIDIRIEDYFRNLKSIGEVKTTKLSLQGKYKIIGNAECTGSCLLDDGSLLLTDLNNRKLLKLDKKYNIVQTCHLNYPMNVCKTGPNDIAVVLGECYIQLLSTRNGKLKVKSSFKICTINRCVAYSNGELFVSSMQGVYVYNLSGEELRQFQSFSTRHIIWEYTSHLDLSKDGAQVYVADGANGVHVFDRQGNFQTTITSPDLKSAWGLCTLENNIVLVSCRENCSIVMINCSTRKSKVLLLKEEIVDEPSTLCYDNTTDRLIVTFNNHIKVFSLIRK